VSYNACVGFAEEIDMRTARGRRGRFTPRQRPIIYKAPLVGGALINQLLPRYDFRDARQVVILATPEAVYEAVMQRDFLRLPLIRAFFAVREFPVRAWRRLTGGPVPASVPHATLADLTKVGAFTILAEHPGQELMLGAVGRPWRPDYEPTYVSASAFAGFQEPGFAKMAWSWIVKPLGSGQSLLVTEWRTQLTDDEARALFRRYWTVVSKGVRLLARVGLARIKADCEREVPTTHASS
jgi:hypothetical protein